MVELPPPPIPPRHDGNGHNPQAAVELLADVITTSTDSSNNNRPSALARRATAPNLVIGYLVPELDSYYTPLSDLFQLVIDDLQAQGVLPGVNVSVVPKITGDKRATVLTDVVEFGNQQIAGLIGVGGMYPVDAIVTASTLHLPFCEAAANDSALVSPASYPSLFRTVPDIDQWASAAVAILQTQGWSHYAALFDIDQPPSTSHLSQLSTLPPAFLTAIPLNPTPADYTDALLRVQKTQLAVIVPLGMTSASYVWITLDDAYEQALAVTALTGESDLLRGSLVVTTIAGQGPAYANLLSRWDTSEFRAKYPLLANVTIPPPDNYLYMHTCLELFLRGYNNLISNNITSFPNPNPLMVPGAATAGDPDSIPWQFNLPDVMTVTGLVYYAGSTTRVGTYVFNYVSNGALVEFATYINATLNVTAPVAWFGGTKPPEFVTASAPPETSKYWITKVVVPIVVVATVIIICVLLLLLRQHWKRQQEIGPAPKQLLPLMTVDIKSPAEKAMEILNQVKASSGRQTRRLSHYEIDFIIEVLGSGAMGFTPDIAALEDGHGERVDNETRAWVMDLLAATPTTHPSTSTAPSATPGLGRQGSDGVPAAPTPPDMRRTSRSALAERDKRASFDQDRGRRSIPEGVNILNLRGPRDIEEVMTVPSMQRRRGSASAPFRTPPLIESSSEANQEVGLAGSWANGRILGEDDAILKDLGSLDQVKITDYLTVWYHSWNFDMFHFTEMTNGHPLLYSGLYLLQTTETLGQLQLDIEKFKRWLLLMEAEYHPHPYHNATHAADVLHGLNYLLLEDPTGMYYTPLEMLALVLSAIGHDIDHPGYNNAFLVKSHHPWAILYCDTSVLELHHCAHLFNKTLNSPWNIFADLGADEYDEVRKLVIKLILATDMSKHFEYINKFKSRMSAGTINGTNDLSPENRLAIAEMAIKCADLCNPSKTFPLSKKWTDAVMEEFFMQGDKEKELGLPVSQFMDRTNTNVPKCQIGFIDFLVAPLFDAWNTFHSSDEKTVKIIREIAKNRAKWTGLTISQQLQQQQQQQQQQQLQQQSMQSFQGAQISAAQFVTSLPAAGSANTSSVGMGDSGRSITSRYSGSLSRVLPLSSVFDPRTSGGNISQHRAGSSSGSFPAARSASMDVTSATLLRPTTMLPSHSTSKVHTTDGGSGPQPFPVRTHEMKEGGGIIMNTAAFNFPRAT
ncbi:High affinity cAMP-specific 3',5'-cyclic phosphodiesterase 7A [Geranomyces variabilis]|uniref:Phosphodiesterase n=1 Tax=Geranomyces variabilis TaxID=109894 RepID=A0AAD5TFF8_9FUNG|nr:High affinity cAMP-specific 3',5'-cyclic phosphodiesterase 7A [Geranomyces variabilis]